VAAVSAMLAARGDGLVVVGGKEGEVVEVGGVDVAGKMSQKYSVYIVI
jgi:hypothetical protein